MHVSSPSSPPGFRYVTPEEAEDLKQNSWECVICYDSDMTRPVVTHCKPSQHSIHADCALPYLKDCELCPVCREKVDWRNLSSVIDRIVYSTAVREAIAFAAEQVDSLSQRAIICGAFGFITGLLVMSFPLAITGIGVGCWGLSLGKKELAEDSFSLGIDLAQKEKEILEARGMSQSQINVAQIEAKRLQNEIQINQWNHRMLTAMQAAAVILGVPGYCLSVQERGGTL